MVKREFYITRSDGINLYKSYSDQSVKIQKVGTEEIYDEAIDVENAPYEYVETDIPIEPTEDDATSDDYEEQMQRLGVDFNEET